MKHLSRQSDPLFPHGRSGLLLVGIIVALILLSALATILPVVLRGVAKQRQLEQFDRLAQVELGNAIARLQADGEKSVKPSDWFVERYPDAVLETEQLEMGGAKMEAEQSWRVTVSRSLGDNLPDQIQSVVTWVENREAME